ncbi:hypothetical protein H310_12128 [Aphanomyces invadans]|uniref:Uncharacterized protein n=1 Tax=Aphanomyces invadans TaxID=157072 RepID=A0A024TJE1_9STRA|nr:hypothetical protein H310_12128 [Aphanomyces invadans]ETV94114.1 hypothetical protein H310_12128 [Aphanomyces invadans]|eukprot:XP_008877317.1 hypothetical protein H310_12128 [Aphanomyces invadans]
MPPTRDGSAGTWIDATRAELTSTDEWNALTSVIYDRVQERLKSCKTKQFADLSVDERALVMAQVEIELLQHQAYGAFVKRLTHTMDAHLTKDVDTAFVRPGNTLTKQGLAMESAAKAASALVQDLPVEHRSMLRLLFNQPFPPSFRPEAWKLFLSDPTARFKYESKCAVNRISTISVLDAQLTLKCQTVLDTFPSFVPLQSQNTVMAMKTALSYIHTITPDALDTMGDAYYALILPLLLVWRVTDASSLVEAYSVLLALARPVVLDDAFTSTVVHRLNSIDASFVAALTALFPPESPPLASWTEMLQPHADRVFVGVTTPDTLLFIWDQLFLVGHGRLLPELCAAFLTILQPQWTFCTTFASLVSTITSLSATVQVWQLQDWITKYAATSLCHDLDIETVSTDYLTAPSSELSPRVNSPAHEPLEAPSSAPPMTGRRSAPTSPRRGVPPGPPSIAENIFAPFVVEFESALTALFAGTRDGDMEQQCIDLKMAAEAHANGFDSHVRAFQDAITSVFLDNSPPIRSAATAEECFQADLVVQCQKAVFGRTYTPIDVRDLTGKAKASYEKKLPKYVAAYTQKLAKARK